MRFEILGPLRVSNGARQLHVYGPRQQKLLIALLLQAGHSVSRGELAQVLWGVDVPPTGRAQISNGLTAVRRTLGSDLHIVASGGGFVLDIDGHQLDATEFVALCDEARRLAEPAEAVARLRAALALWRGPALNGFTDGFLGAAARRLEEQRLSCLERRLVLDLYLSRYDEIVGELAALTAEHPLRETLVELDMLALYRSGRQANALEAYHRLRARLANDLGVDPSPRLQQLYTSILRNDVRLTDGRTALRALPETVGSARVPERRRPS